MQKWFFNEIIPASSSKKKTFFQHSLVNSYIYAKYLYSGEQGLSSDRSMMIIEAFILELQREDHSGKKVPKYRRQTLPEK